MKTLVNQRKAMPNGISSYNVYKGAGEAMGEFESSLGDVEGIRGDVD